MTFPGSLWILLPALLPWREPPAAAPPAAYKKEFIAIAEALEAGNNRFLGQGNLRDLSRELRDPRLNAERRMALSARLASELLRAGRLEDAGAKIDQAMRLARRFPDFAAQDTSRFRLRALWHLRNAELENCITLRNADCCLLPLEGGGRHRIKGPAEAARRDYGRILQRNPEDAEVRWLYNIVSMALGEYPDGVDEDWRVPEQRFASQADIGRFVDVGGELGVDVFDLCGGVAVEDFNGDGRLDVVTSTYDPRGEMHLFLGGSGLTFRDGSKGSGLEDQLGAFNPFPADYDADGDVDLFVARGGWLQDDGKIRNSLLQNDGSGRFTDVTRAVGLAAPAYPTQAAVWGDFDGDGQLDLYVANESRSGMDRKAATFPSQLYRNDGEGGFGECAAEAGVQNERFAKGVTAGDYDNDGDLDLYVSNWGPNRLYRNDGKGHFQDVAGQHGVHEPRGRSFATWFFDQDNDGWLDLFVTAFQAKLEDVALWYLGEADRGVRPKLFQNRDGRFQDRAVELGLDRPMLPMGANFGDLDNDGWLDVYLATGDVGLETLTPNVVFRNAGGQSFQDVTTAAGLGHLQKGHGIAFADLDDDGDQDIYNQLGGFFPVDRFSNALFENPGHGARFLHVRLEGTQSNRSAIGARLDVFVEEDGQERRIHRAVGSVSSFGGSPLRQEIGLGSAQRILAVEVTWPGSRRAVRYEDIPFDASIRIVEGEENFARLPLYPGG